LLPRLAAFEAAHPGVTPYVAAAADPLRQDGDAPDVRIAHGPQVPGTGWQVLVRDTTVVAGAVPLTGDLADVMAMRAVHIDSPGGIASGTVDWAAWAAAKGVAGMPRGPHVSAEHVAADLVMQGGAMMLASEFTLAGAFAAGRLHAMPGSRVDAGVCYWVRVERPGPVAAAFVAWLRAAVSKAVADQAG
jgi:DNA-binding transcriptional LysR family regulator